MHSILASAFPDTQVTLVKGRQPIVLISVQDEDFVCLTVISLANAHLDIREMVAPGLWAPFVSTIVAALDRVRTTSVSATLDLAGKTAPKSLIHAMAVVMDSVDLANASVCMDSWVLNAMCITLRRMKNARLWISAVDWVSVFTTRTRPPPLVSALTGFPVAHALWWMWTMTRCVPIIATVMAAVRQRGTHTACARTGGLGLAATCPSVQSMLRGTFAAIMVSAKTSMAL